MYFVYILQSQSDPTRYYTGFTEEPSHRLDEHNRGKSPHTARHIPWRIKNLIGFADREKALAFERYLKSGSGRAFTIRHL